MTIIIIFILISAGIFSILSSVLKLPPYSATQRLRGVAGKTKMTETLNQRLLLPVMKLVAPFIRLDDFKERRMKIKLERAGIIFTPKEYYARAVVMAAGTAIIGTHLFLVGATPSRLLTSSNSGLFIIIPIALAVSIDEPPPIAII